MKHIIIDLPDTYEDEVDLNKANVGLRIGIWFTILLWCLISLIVYATRQ